VPKELAERWSARTGQIEKAAREFKANYGREPNARELVERVTEKSSMVSERELYATAYERSAGACHPSEAQQLVHDLARSGELIALQGGKWTTKELREREQQTIATVKERAGERAAPVREQSLKQAQKDVQREIGAPLSKEQREALGSITGRGGVSTLIGQAGTGNGVVLSAASNAWQKDGYNVIGTAVAGATAERLGADAKTSQSLTTDALLSRMEKGTMTLDESTVVVMDEAGMADTNRLSQLVERTAEKEAKLVLVGDSAQLSPIGAGGLFNHVTENAPKAELKETHRAEHQWEREAWEQVREGNSTKALAAYQAHDRLHVADTREQAAEKMVADWNVQRMEHPEGRTVMLTDSSNEELDKLNKQAQEYRDRTGELGNDRATLPGARYSLAAGDQVIFTKPLFQPGQDRVENGTLGTVKDVKDEHTLTIDTKGAKEREVSVNTSEFNDLRLGYAQHVYKAQGLTANNALTLIGGWQTDRERAYVALTRAREQTNIYTAREDLGRQGMNVEAIDRLAERIAESHAQQASITTPVADRSLAQTPEPKLETAQDLKAGQSIEPGVGAFSPHGPDPSPEPNPEQAGERSSAAGSDSRDREPDALTHDQANERDPDQDRGFSLGIE
jgi:ATP-dependent exoDNAse (exonuclease V) alpha subunit